MVKTNHTHWFGYGAPSFHGYITMINHLYITGTAPPRSDTTIITNYNIYLAEAILGDDIAQYIPSRPGML